MYRTVLCVYRLLLLLSFKHIVIGLLLGSVCKTTYRKYKESAHVSLLDHPISQPSSDISPIWTPVITAEIKKQQLRQI
jgi:hypothetical protein